MPFTPSHAAAVLPFLRTPLPASALVAGSIAPDLPYYLPAELPWATHTALAVVSTDLLLALAAWALWHGLLAEPARRAAPAALRGRLTDVAVGLRARVSTASQVAWTVLAAAVGAATHVLWDEFTHAGGWGPGTFPVLSDQWVILPGYRWLQYVFSLLGGLVLVGWAVRWWLRAPVRPSGRPGRRWPWVLLAVTACVTGTTAAASADGVGEAVYDAATWGGGAALAVAAVLAAAWQLRHRGRRPAPARPSRRL